MEERCETCRFWRPFDDHQRSGLCRVHAPDDRGAAHSWPKTDREDWCGEYHPASLTPPERKSHDAE